jgi:probable F420-dependent oxidoreductase
VGKVRIGYGLGARTELNDENFGVVVDALENLGFDSLWVSERVGSSVPDPLVALAYAAGRTRRLKLGTSVMVLPGRNPVLLAKELASLDRLSGGRLLPAFGLGAVDPNEQQAFGVARQDRARVFDEALSVIRSCWTGEPVHHHGPTWQLHDVTVEPRPHQATIDVWLGGIAPSELRRVGRLADGWLPSFVTPEDAAAGRVIVEETAAAHDRTIDPEHFGVLVPYATGPLPERVVAGLRARRPDLDDIGALVPSSWPALVELIGGFADIGFSKFVVVPFVQPLDGAAWVDHLTEAATYLLPLET